MKLKYTKQDTGLYVALVIAGAGAGLLVGALVASTLRKRRERREQEEFIFEGPAVEYNMPDPFGTVVVEDAFDEFLGEVEEVDPGANFTEEKLEGKESEEEVVITKEEWMSLIEDYNPNPVQLEMVRSGLVTIEDMRESLKQGQLLREEEDEQYTAYSEIYRPKPADAKPDLKEILELGEHEDPIKDELVADRWLILNPDDAEDFEVTKEFEWSPDDQQFIFSSSRGFAVTSAHIDEYVLREDWIELGPIVEEAGDVYIQDYSSLEIYRFTTVDEDGESGAASNVSESNQ